MRNVSEKYQQTMEKRRDFYAAGKIVFADGREKEIGKGDFCTSGNEAIDSAGSTSFPLGMLIPRQIKINLMNEDERWLDYDFYGAKITLSTKYDLDDGTTESLLIGTFTIISPEDYGTTIQATAMDESYKADKKYSTTMQYPMSLGVALRDSCQTCGIELKTQSFANSDYIIPEAPTDITHRQFIGMCAMIAGGNARFDEYNRLEILGYDFSIFEALNLYDGGKFSPWTKGDVLDGGSFNPWDDGASADGGQFGDRKSLHILYQYKMGLRVDVDDVVITGVQITDDEQNTYLYGKEGYVLSLENQLGKGKEEELLQRIGEKIVGLRFRPFTGDHIALPTAEFMDLAYIIDRNYRAYQTVLTDVGFTYFGFTTIKCSADSPIRNSSTSYGNEAKAIVEARKMVEKEKTAREQALETLANELAHSSGLYITPEEQEGGSTIYYMHDKPTLGESMIIWKLTAEAFGISTDGGKTYPYGLDVSGAAILERIYTVGLDADHITTGAFEIRKGNKVMVLMDKDTGQVILRPEVFELSDGSTIESIAQGKVDAQTQEDVFNKLTEDGKRKGIYLKNGEIYVNLSYLQTGALKIQKNGRTVFLADADNGRVEIVADQFSLSSGKTIQQIAEDAVDDQTQQDIFDKLTGGSSANGVYLSNGRLYINADYINSGTISANKIYGGELKLGGSGNSYGTLRILDSGGAEIGHWNNSGISVTLGTITSTSGSSRLSISGGVMTAYYNNASVGYLGSTGWNGSESYRGFLFSCNYDAYYICWASKLTSGSSVKPTVRLHYANKDYDGFERDTLYAACPMQFRSYVYFGSADGLSNSLARFINHTGGLGMYANAGNTLYLGYASTNSNAMSVLNVSSSGLDCHSDLDMNNWSILNQSDERLKTNIEEATEEALPIVNSIGLYSYDWLQDGSHRNVGFIAQQIEAEATDDLVNVSDRDGHYSVRETAMIPYLVKAIQELSEKVEKLEGGIKTVRAARKRWTPTPYSLEEKEAYLEKLLEMSTPGEPVEPEEIELKGAEDGKSEETNAIGA